MKVLVNEMPKKKEVCLFYRKLPPVSPLINEEVCNLTGKACNFKNEDSIFGGECRCLRVGGR